MADFVKKTWACGDSITADELNRMENGIEEAVECCGGGSAGYSCTEGYVSLYDGNVTTSDEDNPPYAEVSVTDIFGEDEMPASLKVTFNGTEYICSNHSEVSLSAAYGATDVYDAQEGVYVYNWDEYPFVVFINANSTSVPILTENDGTYQLQIEYPSIVIETSECFDRAVSKATPRSSYIVHETFADGNNDRILTGMTAEEMFDAFDNGASITVHDDNSGASYKIIGVYAQQACSASYTFKCYRYNYNTFDWEMATFIANVYNNYVPTLVTA